MSIEEMILGFAKDSVFLALFIWIFAEFLRTNKAREEKLNEMISINETIKKDIADVKEANALCSEKIKNMNEKLEAHAKYSEKEGKLIESYFVNNKKGEDSN